MKGLGFGRARVVGRIGVSADVVAIKHDETPAFVREVIVPALEAHALGHERLLVVGHGKVVVAQHVVPRRLELAEDGADHVEAGEIAVDEIPEVHHEREIQLVVMGHAFTELAGRIAVFASAAGFITVLAVGNRAEPKDRLRSVKLGHPDNRQAGKEDTSPHRMEGCRNHGLESEQAGAG